jgi:flagellar motility protein MotE (MotC chaperone)
MAGDKANGSGYSRLDQLEMLMQAFQNGLHSLLESQGRLVDSQGTVTDQLGKLTGTLGSIVGILEDIATAQRYLQQELADLKDVVRELREAQKLTDERLNSLIEMVEGVVRRRAVQ